MQSNVDLKTFAATLHVLSNGDTAMSLLCHNAGLP